VPKVKQSLTYDEAVLSVLTWEFSPIDPKTIEKKIKRKLRNYELGAFDEERVERLRRLKNQVVAEIEKTKDSNYYSKGPSEFAELSDFDIDRMTTEWRKNFSDVSDRDMHNFIAGAIYLYYLR